MTRRDSPDHTIYSTPAARNYYQPLLVLTDADGGKYCFCYGFDGYTSIVSYTALVERTSGEYEEALKTVRLELAPAGKKPEAALHYILV